MSNGLIALFMTRGLRVELKFAHGMMSIVMMKFATALKKAMMIFGNSKSNITVNG